MIRDPQRLPIRKESSFNDGFGLPKYLFSNRRVSYNCNVSNG